MAVRVVGGFLALVGIAIAIPDPGGHPVVTALSGITTTGLLINELTGKGTRNTTVIISLSDDP